MKTKLEYRVILLLVLFFLTNNILSQEKQSPDIFDGYKEIKFFSSMNSYSSIGYSLVNQKENLTEYSVEITPSESSFLETTISDLRVFEYKNHIVSITLYLNNNVQELITRLFKNTKTPREESFKFIEVEDVIIGSQTYLIYDYWKEYKIFEGENIILKYGKYQRERRRKWTHNWDGEELKGYYYLTIEVKNYEKIIDDMQVSTNFKKYISDMGVNQVTNESRINEKLEQSNNIISKSDISINIPITSNVNKNCYALIIGNQNYKNDIKVPFAINDALVVKEYFNKTLGIPENNMRVLLDATYGNIINEIDWLKNVQKIYSTNVKIYLYYAGHGIPNEKTNIAFILPVDGNSLNTRTAIALNDIYTDLSEYNSKLVTIFLDACFTGDSRTGMLQSARAVRVRPKTSSVFGNIIVFSATTNDETAMSYEEQSHGLFTFYFLYAIKETKGNLSYKFLFESLNKNVSQKSLLLYNKIQSPSMIISPQLESIWENIYLNK